ncbi:serine--tRNA synthetase-like protein Slimp isoform X2 [Prorops nasuta]|uniref:serine--tRNA synthetase-like protein Slimp isoform X2 n=1 Tax=Prorops nasuta TaxID=863751 RepID=UPI0034CF773B
MLLLKIQLILRDLILEYLKMANMFPKIINTLKYGRRNTSHQINKYQSVLFLVKRSYSSALYVTSEQANKTCVHFLPYLDFDERYADLDKLQHEICLRGLNMDVAAMKESWQFYKDVDKKRQLLVEKRKEISKTMMEILAGKQVTENKENAIEALRNQGRILKNDLKEIKHTLSDLEETIVVRALKLPNELDDRTPKKEPVILKTVGKLKLDEKCTKSHIEIGSSLNLLEYRNPMNYYLSNEATVFELGLLKHAGKLLSGAGMLRVSGTDFCRSSVVEASGIDHEDPASVFILKHNDTFENLLINRMHLVGGASLISFLAMHTRHIINSDCFPLQYFSLGKQYMPSSFGGASNGLFNVNQESIVQAFVVAKNENSDEYRQEFDKLLEKTCDLYNDVCEHYRVVLRPAAQLQTSESLRISFELWSSFLQQYIEVGYISAFGTYLSKRLLITYKMNNDTKFPSVIAGSLVSVPKLIGCLLEQNPSKFNIPTKIGNWYSSK